jgi:hypothetical protein
MFKFILVLLGIGLSTSLWSQRDFDYTIYTNSNYQIIKHSDRVDTLDLTLDRKFTKVGGLLRETSILNTGGMDVEYKIEYVGFSKIKETLMFGYIIKSIDGKPEEDMVVFINPMLGKVVFVAGDLESIYE